MKNESVIIFVDGSNLYLTPKPVRDSIAKAPLTATPIFAVFDPAIEKNLGVLGYSGIRKREGLKNIMAEIAKMRGDVPET
jgi:hypothetical protein